MRHPHRTARLVWLGGLGASLVAAGCASPPPPPAPHAVEVEVYRRAETDRSEQLSREIERLREDLRQAEAAMVAIESGLRGTQTRADAVSALADARILVERAREMTPWRPAAIEEAQAKLDEADGQLRDGNFGSAIFFSSRASRIAGNLIGEAKRVDQTREARFVAGARVNLRAAPSTEARVIETLVEQTPVFHERTEGDWALVRTTEGQVGWIWAPLLRDS